MTLEARFERAFQWSMRYGARILFAFAGLELILGLFYAAFQFAQMTGQIAAGSVRYSMASADYISLFTNLLATLGRAFWPFFAALSIGHLERWAKEREISN